MTIYQLAHITGLKVEIAAINLSEAIKYLGWNLNDCQLIKEFDSPAALITVERGQPMRMSEFRPNLVLEQDQLDLQGRY